jgi:NAD(P)-dependent dehydrogenase (short-subunit alcohol dehydrogenase family)
MNTTGAARLEGKVAIVTGASQGIGRAICLEFARQGAFVIAAARNVAKLEETARQGEGRIVPQACDVTKSADIQALVDTAVNRFGSLDILVNNAGVSIPAPLVDTSEETWDDIMATNVKGTFLGIKHAIPALAASGGGSIINIGSINSFIGEKLSTPYVTSKGAVLMLTKNAAAECAEHNIRVNAICPGATATSMADEFFEAMGSREAAEKWMTQFQPMGGMIPPEQIAYAAVYLGSDESTSMTGTSILIDGGLMAHWDHV